MNVYNIITPNITLKGKLHIITRDFRIHRKHLINLTKIKNITNKKKKKRGNVSICYATAKEVSLLDYGAGNVRSIRNAIKKLGFKINEIDSPSDIANAEKLIFPGVGSFGAAMDVLKEKDYINALKEYIQSNKSFFGICLGLQLLFDGSDENGGCEGLGIIPGNVVKFDSEKIKLPVPHIGWNTVAQHKNSILLNNLKSSDRVYFVHSYHCICKDPKRILATSTYGHEFLAAIGNGNVFATQFHPEKSGRTGLSVLGSFLLGIPMDNSYQNKMNYQNTIKQDVFIDGLAKRIIACLDVRANDQGDLVVTKGDQYDVRESDTEGNPVRNLGQPVSLATRYFNEGADEVTFLNITGFRDFPLSDLPMLSVLEQTSKGVFVPLTVGGGIQGFKDSTGKEYSALEVASAYFRSGADKISIGSDAVYTAEEYLKTGIKTGKSSIEQISEVYGAQAVVISIDPMRVYVKDPSHCHHCCIQTKNKGPDGEAYCWWQCTVKGGRETRDIDAVELAVAMETLGAGEILLNCIDKDGQKDGFDLELIEAVSSSVSIPVIASSGAGNPQHFTDVFDKTHAAAALAAGIFHRGEVEINQIKSHMAEKGIPTRL